MANASTSSISFTLSTPKRYGPRIGNIVLRRPDASSTLQIPTPAFLTSTSRGVVPHLSRDHQRQSVAIRWLNVPFETFLEHNPPVPTLQPGKDPLHTFLGFTPGKQIVSMSARDPYDGREMPPNGNAHVSVYSLRGVRKLSPVDWRSHVLACQPDVVFALSDTPYTDPPYSQKRLTKSIERSASWLSTLLRPISSPLSTSDTTPSPPSILVHMAGGTSIPARKAFADSLLETLYGPEAEAIKPFKTLDEGVAGYTFDLMPLRQSLDAIEKKENISSSSTLPSTVTSTPTPSDPTLTLPTHTENAIPLLRASLSKLPIDKLRLANSTEGPHEVLGYITNVGVDVFDARWAQRAADVGVALDFEFPVPIGVYEGLREEKKEIGHNLYETKFALDFGTLADAFRGEYESPPAVVDASSTHTPSSEAKPICPCAACSPQAPLERIYHGVDTPEVSLESSTPSSSSTSRPHYTRAYIHHLLHTHEMSAHALLVMHNLAVLERFFEGVRGVIASCSSSIDIIDDDGGIQQDQDQEQDLNPNLDEWTRQVKRFGEVYEDSVAVFARARASWRDVDLARGKGRLARERDRQED